MGTDGIMNIEQMRRDGMSVDAIMAATKLPKAAVYRALDLPMDHWPYLLEEITAWPVEIGPMSVPPIK